MDGQIYERFEVYLSNFICKFSNSCIFLLRSAVLRFSSSSSCVFRREFSARNPSSRDSGSSVHLLEL